MCLVFLLKIITGGKVVLLRCKNSMSWLRKVVTDKRPHASARGPLGCPWFGPKAKRLSYVGFYVFWYNVLS